MNKLDTLFNDWYGIPNNNQVEIDEVLPGLIMDSVSPGICMNPSCDYTTEVEPDCYHGYCEICETQTVKSLLALIGMI